MIPNMTPPNITPGKWILDDGFLRRQDMAEQILDPGNETWIAVGYADEDGYAASVAYAHPWNAQAIAALPDLLVALEKCHAFIAELQTGGYAIDCDHERDVVKDALTKAGYTF